MHHPQKSDAKLDKYRTSIDELDEQLLEILAKRMEISELIGKLKEKHNMAPYQPERWLVVLEDRMQKAYPLKLNKDFVKKIFDVIHLESIRRQG